MVAIEQNVAPEAPGASAEAIQHHYDVGNEFFALWLDPTLSYSCALWAPGDDDLQAAQLRKIDYHAEQAAVAGARRVLDIGCGWGGVLRRITEHWGVSHAVGLTLSQAQIDHLRSLGDPRIEVHLKHWADYAPDELFDGIISIGAFEHFARFGDSQQEKVGSYRRFFDKCHDWLAPGKALSLQTIAYGDVERGHPPSDLFIANEVFPQSELPRLADIAKASEGLFEVECVRNDRKHYARTLRCWFDQLRANRAQAVALVGEDQVQRFDRYLRMFDYGFQLGSIVLYRVTLRRIDVTRRTAQRSSSVVDTSPP
jgi:cyclopropane-fatty-acyl-phospholipid synthase